MPTRGKWLTPAALFALSAAFVSVSLLFAAHLGIETDEAMVGNGIYQQGAPVYSWMFGDNEVPVMLISYLGALKTWLVHPLVDLWGPNRISLRLPAILLGAVSLWLFFLFLDRVHSRRAAWIGTLLLATDPSYLLVETTDFGFVALQFVFKLAALVLLVRFHKEGRASMLAGAFFLFGIALWDKAVFLWVLLGLAAGALAVFPRELWRHFSVRNVAIAAVSALVGALPLVFYNIAKPLETLRANVKMEPEPVLAKAIILWRTLNGFLLFDFVTAIDPGQRPGLPKHWYQSLSASLTDLLHHPQHDLTLIALGIAVLLTALLWKTPARKPMLFAIVASIATWLPMILTAGAGVAVQHVILLWPFPFMIIALALAQAPRLIAWTGTVILCLSSAAVTNTYYTDVIRNGPAIHFTDAMEPLVHYLTNLQPPAPVVMGDWGYTETLNLMTEGSLTLDTIDLRDEPHLERTFAVPNVVFVFHSGNFAFQPQIRDFIESSARRHGWQRELLQTVYDQNGRPAFDVFRYSRLHL